MIWVSEGPRAAPPSGDERFHLTRRCRPCPATVAQRGHVSPPPPGKRRVFGFVLTCSAAVRLLAPPGPLHRTAAARLRTCCWRRRRLWRLRGRERERERGGGGGAQQREAVCAQGRGGERERRVAMNVISRENSAGGGESKSSEAPDRFHLVTYPNTSGPLAIT